MIGNILGSLTAELEDRMVGWRKTQVETGTNLEVTGNNLGEKWQSLEPLVVVKVLRRNQIPYSEIEPKGFLDSHDTGDIKRGIKGDFKVFGLGN